MSLIDRMFPKIEPREAPPAGSAPAPNGSTSPPGMVPASKIGKTKKPSGTDADETSELAARRDRLVERFAAMQSDLGGLFYEMAIRDHVKLEVLMRKAAALQRVDDELGQVERQLRLEEAGAAGSCANCRALFTRGSAFCSHCGHALGGEVSTGHATGA